MAIKKYKPTTPGRRGMTVTDYSVLSKVDPERSLLESKKKHAGRNNTGKITVRHHGGGNRVKYRVIDFKRNVYEMALTELSRYLRGLESRQASDAGAVQPDGAPL